MSNECNDLAAYFSRFLCEYVGQVGDDFLPIVRSVSEWIAREGELHNSGGERALRQGK